MFNAKDLLDQVLGANVGGRVRGGVDRVQDYAKKNPLASGAMAGGLAAILLGTSGGRALTGSAAKLGGMALVAGLAYRAFNEWRGGSTTRQTTTAPGDSARYEEPEILPAPSDSGFEPLPEEEQERSLALLTAMISAAKADGYIDEAEKSAIFDKLDQIEFDAKAKEFIRAEMEAPLDLNKVLEPATNPHISAEIYLASLLAIDPDHPAEKAYLAMLAARLDLDDQLVARLHEAAEDAKVPA